ncbi:dihydrofolate reductase family protein, partial [Streptomyces sp. NPDC040724]|uniref:dihydrofolate reductase family protein n=1 Tax=Streptomyces sp. NPDC040724 TaxID=3155612 RepID=UPI0033DE865F
MPRRSPKAADSSVRCVAARLPRAVAELYARGVRSLLLEGGPTLAGAFVECGAV